MDVYARKEPDPVGEWSSPGGQTGLEEPMWQLGLGGVGSGSYPERPDEVDCDYYLRTGFCGYGSRCRYNHPRDRIAVTIALNTGITRGEYPERDGQPECQYYMRTGLCKFGSACKYHHPKGVGSTVPVALNLSGYPLRPGEKECTYYLKTGQCKYGLICKFHHPENENIHITQPPPPPLPPAPPVHPHTIYPPQPADGIQTPPYGPSQPYEIVASNWPVPRPDIVPDSYIPALYTSVFLPPGMIPYPGWNPYQPAVGATSIYGITQLSTVAPAYTGAYLSSTEPSGSSQSENVYLDRPGQPESHYYIENGQYKYGSTAKYHHPPPDKSNYNLTLTGHPSHPGGQLCYNYAENGVCKYGPACKFDHPMGTMSYSPSDSSLTDIPVSPCPVGTLAPSSSSSDLKRGVAETKKNSCSTRMSSSVSTFAESTLSKTDSTPAAAATTDVPSSTSGGSSNTSGDGNSKS